jgi:hypothetical protein
MPTVTVASIDGVAGMTTYRLALSLPSTATNVHSLFGDEANPMVFPTANQDVSAVGADIGGVSPLLLEAFPDSQYDSWLTVGITDGLTGSEISSIGIDFSAWVDTALEVTDGAVFWMVPNNGPSGRDIVIAQLTVATGAIFTATANANGRGSETMVDPDTGLATGDWSARGLTFTNGHADNTSGALGGNCDIDVDECMSSPCANGATCTESTVESEVSFHTYQCTCVAGFANGVCEYDFISEYVAECTVLESDDISTCGGNCDIDVDECVSSPCANGATCTESAVESEVSFHTYQCTCVAGFANGICEYDFITEYNRECTVIESNNGTGGSNDGDREFAKYETDVYLGGNCDIDVDECTSSPCANGATCAESAVRSEVSFHAYQCTCVAGFANGVCEYDFITEYNRECTVMESTFNSNLRGNCDIDVDECSSSPCVNGALCLESIADSDDELRSTELELVVTKNKYTCLCQPGFANGTCAPLYPGYIVEYDSLCEMPTGGHCDIDVNECASSPCKYGVCSDSTTAADVGMDAYHCTCQRGWTGLDCDTDINECDSSPCYHMAMCTESSLYYDPVATAVKFVRLFAMGASIGGPSIQQSWRVVDISLLDDDGNDVVGTTAISSSYAPLHEAESAFDGRLSTFWQAADDAAGEWIGIKFEKVTRLSRVTIRSFSAHSVPSAVALQASVDGVFWTDIERGIEGKLLTSGSAISRPPAYSISLIKDVADSDSYSIRRDETNHASSRASPVIDENRTLRSNEITEAIAIGFSFPFYDLQYASLHIASNGYIVLGNKTFRAGDSSGSPTGLPASDFGIGPLIAPYWASWASSTGPSDISYARADSSFNIQMTSSVGSWQLLLGRDGTITISIDDCSGAASSFTVGWQNPAGDVGHNIYHHIDAHAVGDCEYVQGTYHITPYAVRKAPRCL